MRQSSPNALVRGQAKSARDLTRKTRLEQKCEDRKSRATSDVLMTFLQPDEVRKSRHVELTTEMMEGLPLLVVSTKGKLGTKWLFLDETLSQSRLKWSFFGKPSKPRFQGIGTRSTELHSLLAVTPYTDALPTGYNNLTRLRTRLEKHTRAKKTTTTTTDATAKNPGGVFLVHVTFTGKPDLLYAVDSEIDQDQAAYTWQRLAAKTKSRPSSPARSYSLPIGLDSGETRLASIGRLPPNPPSDELTLPQTQGDAAASNPPFGDLQSTLEATLRADPNPRDTPSASTVP